MQELHISTGVPQDVEMTNIDSLLLYELLTGELSPNELQTALTTSWQLDVSTPEIVGILRRLKDESLVDGPGISLIHHLRVWLTQDGKARARHPHGEDMGGRRRAA